MGTKYKIESVPADQERRRRSGEIPRLSQGRAVERVAQTAHAFWQSPSGRSWIECCEKLPQQAEWFRRLARAILATGLVADEAAIRADERKRLLNAVTDKLKDETSERYAKGWNNALIAVCGTIRSGGGE